MFGKEGLIANATYLLLERKVFLPKQYKLHIKFGADRCDSWLPKAGTLTTKMAAHIKTD